MDDKKTAAKEVDRKLRAAVKETTLNFLQVGQLLREVREKELWADLGAETFEEYASVVCGLGLKRVNARIRLWEVYSKFELPPELCVPITKMRILVPIVNNKNIRAWLGKAADMSCAELRSAVTAEREKLRKEGKLPRLRKSEQRFHVMGVSMTPDEEGEVRLGIDFAKGYFSDVKTNGSAIAIMMRLGRESLAKKAKPKKAA